MLSSVSNSNSGVSNNLSCAVDSLTTKVSETLRNTWSTVDEFRSSIPPGTIFTGNPGVDRFLDIINTGIDVVQRVIEEIKQSRQ